MARVGQDSQRDKELEAREARHTYIIIGGWSAMLSYIPVGPTAEYSNTIPNIKFVFNINALR